MSKHSPGPWVVEDHKQYPSMFGIVRGPSFLLQWVRFATDITPEQSAQREVDARLIAAAPELLEALKQIAEGLENTRSHPGQYMTTITKDQACRMALAAIAKAEGRA